MKRWRLEQNSVPPGQEVAVTNAHVAGVVEVGSGAPALKEAADLGNEHAGLRLQLRTLGSSQGRTKLLLSSAVHAIISIHPASRAGDRATPVPSLPLAMSTTSRRTFSTRHRIRCAVRHTNRRMLACSSRLIVVAGFIFHKDTRPTGQRRARVRPAIRRLAKDATDNASRCSEGQFLTVLSRLLSATLDAKPDPAERRLVLDAENHVHVAGVEHHDDDDAERRADRVEYALRAGRGHRRSIGFRSSWAAIGMRRSAGRGSRDGRRRAVTFSLGDDGRDHRAARIRPHPTGGNNLIMPTPRPDRGSYTT